MIEIMSTETVLIKSIQSACRVKYATEKDHMGDANLKLPASPGSGHRGDRGCLNSWGSRVSELNWIRSSR
jgi:hypothetical protein